MHDGDPPVRDSVLGRLLQELSWAGPSIRDFRSGGRGNENVLTAEALTGLDFLPRRAFLGSVLRAAHGAELARSRVIEEIEDAEITLLPDELLLRPSSGLYRDQLVVQPDGIMTSKSCYVLIEAKRIRKSSFQPEQLAREYVAVMRDALGRTPLLLLLLGEEPPVAVRGLGRVSPHEAVLLRLDAVLQRAEVQEMSQLTLVAGVPDVVSWITWAELGRVITEQRTLFHCTDSSVERTVSRLALSVTDAISRHS